MMTLPGLYGHHYLKGVYQQAGGVSKGTNRATLSGFLFIFPLAIMDALVLDIFGLLYC